MTSLPNQLTASSHSTSHNSTRGTSPIARDYASEDPLAGRFDDVQIRSSFSMHHSGNAQEPVVGFDAGGPGPLALSESPAPGPAPAYETREAYHDHEKPRYVSRNMHDVWHAAQARCEEVQPERKSSSSSSMYTAVLVMSIILTFALNGVLVYCSMLVVERMEDTALLDDDSGRGLLSGLTGVMDDRTPGSVLAKTAAFAAVFTTLTSIPMALYAWSLKRELTEKEASQAEA